MKGSQLVLTTLLRFLATRSGRPVILRTSGRNALETWIDVDRREPRLGITRDDVLPLLKDRGWRIVEQASPNGAYVVLEPSDGPEPLAAVGDEVDLVVYAVSDILAKVRDFEGPEIRPQPAKDSDEYAGNHFSLTELKTLMEETTGGSEAWSQPNMISVDGNTGTLIVVAPRELHRGFQEVLDNLRR